MKKCVIFLMLLFATNSIFPQIGYQVSLLNSATGQPRAGETVTVDIKLTNSENTTVYTTQQKATSNDFGVLSLSVGDANTFDELDWNKLPLYIEVSIDGVLIAKSQVLSVPVAEYAKKSGFVLTRDFLASKEWVAEPTEGEDTMLNFYSDSTSTWNYLGDSYNANYYIYENVIVLSLKNCYFAQSYTLFYMPQLNGLVDTAGGRIYY